MTIYNQIASNRRKTYLTMFLFVILISILGYVGGEFFVAQGSGVAFLIIAVLLSSLTSIFSYYFSDKMVLGISGAKKVNRDMLPQVYGILDNLCVGAGFKKNPTLYLINDSAPNAFATGRDPDHSAVAVTTGLLEKLNKREIEGVLAHELSHIKNFDTRLMTITAILVGSVSLIANLMLNSSYRDKRNSESNIGGILVLIGLILMVLSPLFAELIKLAISRSREYLADASAALLTRDPEGLASALEKISTDHEPLEVANEATAHLYISNPLKKGVNAGRFANLFNTHPPVSERIAKLRSM